MRYRGLAEAETWKSDKPPSNSSSVVLCPVCFSALGAECPDAYAAYAFFWGLSGYPKAITSCTAMRGECWW